MQPMNRRDFVKLGVAVPSAFAVSPLGLDLTAAADSKRAFRIAGAKQAHSLCPYCAVGCSLVAYTRTGADGRTQLLQMLQDEGLERIPVVGLPFDPHVSEAVTTVPVDDPDQHHVVMQEMLRGYRIKGRIARASRVVIGEYRGGTAEAASFG